MENKVSDLTENQVIEIGKLERLVYNLPYEYTYEKVVSEHQWVTFDKCVFKSQDAANKHIEKCLTNRTRVLKLIKQDVLSDSELSKLYSDWRLLTGTTPKEIKEVKCEAVILYRLLKEDDYSYYTQEVGMFRSLDDVKEAIIDDLNLNIWHTYFEQESGD